MVILIELSLFGLKIVNIFSVIIEWNLSWNDHVQHIEKNVKPGLYYLNEALVW